MNDSTEKTTTQGENVDIVNTILSKLGLGWMKKYIPSLKNIAFMVPVIFWIIKTMGHAYMEGKFSVYGLDNSYINLDENFFVSLIYMIVIILSVVAANASLYFLWQYKRADDGRILKKIGVRIGCTLGMVITLLFELLCFFSIYLRDFDEFTESPLICIYNNKDVFIENYLAFLFALISINFVFFIVCVSYYIQLIWYWIKAIFKLILKIIMTILKKIWNHIKPIKDKIWIFIKPIIREIWNKINLKKFFRANNVENSEENNSRDKITSKIKNYIKSLVVEFNEKVKKYYLFDAENSNGDKVLSVLVGIIVIFIFAIFGWGSIYNLGRQRERDRSYFDYAYYEDNKKTLEHIEVDCTGVEVDSLCYKVIFRNDDIVVLSPVINGKPDYDKKIQVSIDNLVLIKKAASDVEYQPK